MKPAEYKQGRQFEWTKEEDDAVKKDINDTLGSRGIVFVRWLERRKVDSEDEADMMFSLIDRMIDDRNKEIDERVARLNVSHPFRPV